MKISVDQISTKTEQNKGVSSVQGQEGTSCKKGRSREELMQEFSSILDKIAVKLSDEGIDFAGMYSAEITTKIKKVKKIEKRSQGDTSAKDSESEEVKLSSDLEVTQGEETQGAESEVIEEVEEVVVKENESEKPEEVKQEDEASEKVEENTEAELKLEEVDENEEAVEIEEVVELKDVLSEEDIIVEEVVAEEKAEEEVVVGEEVSEELKLEEEKVLVVEEDQAEESSAGEEVTEEVVEETPGEAPIDPELAAPVSEKQAVQEKSATEEESPELLVQEVTESTEKEAPRHGLNQLETKTSENDKILAEEIVEEQVKPEVSGHSNHPESGEAEIQDETALKFLQTLKKRTGDSDSNAAEENARSSSQFESEITTKDLEKIVIKEQDVAIAPLFLKNIFDTGKTGLGLGTQATASAGQGNSANVTAVTEAVKSGDVSQKGAGLLKAKPLPRPQAARTMEKVEAALKEVAKSKDGKTISVRLDPPSLGEVKIDITLRDGILHARMIAEVPQVNNLLRERSLDLQAMLRKLGLNVDQVSVSVGSDQRNAENQTSFSRGKGNNGSRGEAKEGMETAVETVVAERVVETATDHWIA